MGTLGGGVKEVMIQLGRGGRVDGEGIVPVGYYPSRTANSAGMAAQKKNTHESPTKKGVGYPMVREERSVIKNRKYA